MAGHKYMQQYYTLECFSDPRPTLKFMAIYPIYIFIIQIHNSSSGRPAPRVGDGWLVPEMVTLGGATPFPSE